MNKVLFFLLSLCTISNANAEVVTYPNTQIIESENFRALEKRFLEVIPAMMKRQIRKNFELQMWVNGPDATTVRAEALQEGRKGIVRVYGGIPRHQLVTLDGLAMIVCHEVGHHLAGGKKHGKPWQWSSAEGESDYYAGNTCLKRIWLGDDHASYLPQNIHPKVLESCESVYGKNPSALLCMRGLYAAQSMTDFLKSRKSMKRQIDFDFVEKTKKVSETMVDDPSVPCRFKTLVAGVLCQNELGAEKECDRENDQELFSAGKPFCWHSPK